MACVAQATRAAALNNANGLTRIVSGMTARELREGIHRRYSQTALFFNGEILFAPAIFFLRRSRPTRVESEAVRHYYSVEQLVRAVSSFRMGVNGENLVDVILDSEVEAP
jgi:hypothetical protein